MKTNIDSAPLQFCASILLLTCVLASVSCSPGDSKPNIILIMADDLGYGDLGCYGNEIIATPHLDTLAETGLRFTDFYASGAWCLPSRKGLLTGVHPYRDGLRFGPEFSSRQTLPEMLRKSGYATALPGKWHLGMEEGLHPLDQGFDYFYGTEGSNDPKTTDGRIQVYETFRTARKEEDWPVSLFRGHDEVERPAKQSLFTRRYTEEAIGFIRQNKTQPFFLYLAHNMPHVPIFASEKFKGKSKGGLFGDVVEELDWSVGEIMKALSAEGLAENTLVIFDLKKDRSETTSIAREHPELLAQILGEFNRAVNDLNLPPE